MPATENDIFDKYLQLLREASGTGITSPEPEHLSPTGAIVCCGNYFWAQDALVETDAVSSEYERLRGWFVPGTESSGTSFSTSIVSLVMSGRNSPLTMGCTQRQDTERSSSIPEIISEIRANLALQVKELAEVVGVERPTVYGWIKDNATPHKSNHDRLMQVYRISQAWRKISRLPAGAALREFVDDEGNSVIDYMRRDSMNEIAIDALLQSIATRVNSRDREKPKSLRELAEARGIDVNNVKDQSASIDALTGKRSTME
ncbi:hypothetical protein [Blastopirellula marina]|uniref:HTH cro/C1-type domain-containing protein n=1 Tax=Blastopirellula marina DSM 3645 TaxID=314230 RepID=A3ZM14_9BACT|nr:hypothetical protein [Blastopirellula marina]EAQ82797.1 hypothetical protein DSM3645_10367 [Blastopirellula marina DSM 3645]